VTDVSHFWLSIHLLTALFTLAGWCGPRSTCWRCDATGGAARAADRLGALAGRILFVQLCSARGSPGSTPGSPRTPGR
jgi:cytochrome c oxidase assembly protein subunit 15